MPLSDDSLDDLYSEDSYYSDDEEYRLAQQEWEESLNQLQQLVTVVLLPFFGKWLGRRWSYWGELKMFVIYNINIVTNPLSQAYDRYLRLGLGKSFIWGERLWATGIKIPLR